jgi:hypothetical protein
VSDDEHDPPEQIVDGTIVNAVTGDHLIGDAGNGRHLARDGKAGIFEPLPGSFEERTDDATRLTLAMILFVSRFIPVKRQSRFLSGRISRPSQWSVAASPFSISPATSLAESRAQQRGVPEKPTDDEAVAVCSKGRDYHPGGPSSMTFQAGRPLLFLAM